MVGGREREVELRVLVVEQVAFGAVVADVALLLLPVHYEYQGYQ